MDKVTRFMITLSNSSGCLLSSHVGEIVEGQDEDYIIQSDLKKFLADSIICIGDSIKIEEIL